MKYATFERIVLLLGGLSVLATLGLAYRTPLLIQEVVAQLLVFVVLFGAVHWGRRGGFIAAAAASVIYVIIWIPELEPAGSVSSQLLLLMLMRVLAYGLIGIVGGALCARMKYVLVSLDEASGVDDITGIFSEHTLSRLVEAAIARHQRYQEPFCLIVLNPTTTSLRSPNGGRERTLVRQLAAHLRSDIRMIDEAGRTKDGRLVVLLPHTPKEGGIVVRERLDRSINKLAGGEAGERFKATCLGAAEDTDALADILSNLEKAPAGQVLSPA